MIRRIVSLSPVSVVVAELADVVARHRLQRPHRVPALELVVPAWRREVCVCVCGEEEQGGRRDEMRRQGTGRKDGEGRRRKEEGRRRKGKKGERARRGESQE